MHLFSYSKHVKKIIFYKSDKINSISPWKIHNRIEFKILSRKCFFKFIFKVHVLEYVFKIKLKIINAIILAQNTLKKKKKINLLHVGGCCFVFLLKRLPTPFVGCIFLFLNYIVSVRQFREIYRRRRSIPKNAFQ